MTKPKIKWPVRKAPEIAIGYCEGCVFLPVEWNMNGTCTHPFRRRKTPIGCAHDRFIYVSAPISNKGGDVK
jgi:hypothetical protein